MVSVVSGLCKSLSILLPWAILPGVGAWVTRFQVKGVGGQGDGMLWPAELEGWLFGGEPSLQS